MPGKGLDCTAVLPGTCVMVTDALFPTFLPAFAVAFVGGGMLYLPSAFSHSSLPQSPSEHLEQDGDDKESFIQGLPCG